MTSQCNSDFSIKQYILILSNTILTFRIILLCPRRVRALHLSRAQISFSALKALHLFWKLKF